MRKRLSALAVAFMLVYSFATVSVFAYTTVDLPLTGSVYNEDADVVNSIAPVDGKVTGDYDNPSKKFYVQIDDENTSTVTFDRNPIPVSDLFNSDDFTFKISRDQNGKYLDTVKFVSRKLDASTGTRSNYIEVTLKDSTILEDVKVTFDVYFQARRSVTDSWSNGDRANARFELWISNKQVSGDDATIGTGEGVVFNPVSNETNTITWGNNYDVASIKFTANSDAKKFYAKLSTRVIRDIYSEYGDPVDADLYFRTFVGNPTIDATSRATLTLYNPWDPDYGNNNHDYRVDPRDCYIYQVNSYGELEDITSLFTYVNGDKTDSGIDGWQARVRVLGTYVISDTDLEVEDSSSSSSSTSSSSSASTPAPRPPVAPPTPGATIPSPPTGAGDKLAVAIAFAAVSAGVVVCLKKRKV